jgi:ubiquitin-protein ligase E3 C
MPNPNSAQISDLHLKIYEFLGFIVGIAIIEDIKIWPNFSPFFLNDLFDIENSFMELKNYDPDLYKNLVQLKSYEGDIENDMGLNFTLSEEKDGKIKTLELIENGRNINVDNNNKLLYIKKVAQYKLYYQFKDQIESFKRGLFRVIDEEILKLFTSDELRQLITGFDKPIDIHDLKAHTKYGKNVVLTIDHWNYSDPKDVEAISSFWEIMQEFDDKEREKLLFFVTSLKRPPISV